MVETKLFQGVTLQKSNRGDVRIEGDITCADDSTKYANVALCYEIGPFGGKRRDEIVRELAANVGIPAEKVFVPVGSTVTKPILLSNSSLLPFVNELGAPENWFAYFDENGNFVVKIIELKSEPDWTIDARRGDYDFDQIDETPPTLATRRYYASGTVPVEGTGTESTTTPTEISAFYNPKTLKVRPSGGASFLQSDGSYRTLVAPEEMVIGRVLTEITSEDGRETKRVISTHQFYNPMRYDPNFDTDPPGTSYDGAYGDKTFHRDEVESLMLVKRLTIESQYDIYGTLQQRIETTEGWNAPRRAGNWSADRQRLTNLAGVCFVFPGGTTRTMAEEQFMVTDRVELTKGFGPDGAQISYDTKKFAWFSPPHWADLATTTTDGGGGGGGGDPYIEPPPPPPPPVTGGWDASFQGPTAREKTATRTVRYSFSCGAVGSMIDYVTSIWNNVVVASMELSGGTMDGRNVLSITGETATGDVKPKTLTLTITYPAFMRVRSRYDAVASALLRVTATNGDIRTGQIFFGDLDCGSTYLVDPNF